MGGEGVFCFVFYKILDRYFLVLNYYSFGLVVISVVFVGVLVYLLKLLINSFVRVLVFFCYCFGEVQVLCGLRIFVFMFGSLVGIVRLNIGRVKVFVLFSELLRMVLIMVWVFLIEICLLVLFQLVLIR